MSDRFLIPLRKVQERPTRFSKHSPHSHRHQCQVRRPTIETLLRCHEVHGGKTSGTGTNLCGDGWGWGSGRIYVSVQLFAVVNSVSTQQV